MYIWLLALILFACLGYAGFAMGAIRAAASLIGLLVAAFLAPILGKVFTPVLTTLTVKNPTLLWVLGPFIAFIVILAAFKIAGHFAHRKVDVYYKYKAGDLRMGLFNRLNRRVGIAVGIINACVYLVLISWVVYAFSYFTYQIAPEGAAWSVRTLNTAGENLQGTGMAKIAGAVDGMPDSYYQTADLAGLIYHNDLLEGRLMRYPGLLALGQQPTFQDIGNDKDFTELRMKQPPIADIINNPKAQAVLNDPELLNNIWAALKPDLTDLLAYMKTGQSAKYDNEKILGKWDFDLKGAVNAVKRAKPNVTIPEMKRIRYALSLTMAKATFIATPEPAKAAYLKDFGKLVPAKKDPRARPGTRPAPPTVETHNFTGTWSSDGSKYQINLPDKGGALEAQVEGDTLIVTGDVLPMVFQRD